MLAILGCTGLYDLLRRTYTAQSTSRYETPSAVGEPGWCDGVFEELAGALEADATQQASPPGVILHAANAIDENAVAQVDSDLCRRILRTLVSRSHPAPGHRSSGRCFSW